MPRTKKAPKLETKTWTVLSYCAIPEEVRLDNSTLNEASCDVYVEYDVTPIAKQGGYDDNFELDNWIIDNYPELEGKKVLIHVDY